MYIYACIESECERETERKKEIERQILSKERNRERGSERKKEKERQIALFTSLNLMGGRIGLIIQMRQHNYCYHLYDQTNSPSVLLSHLYDQSLLSSKSIK